MYDQESGQVFREYVLPPRPSAYKAGRDWSRRTDLPPWKGRGGQGRRGPRSLADISMHSIAENIGLMSHEHLSRRDLPVRYLRRIWRLLENRGVCLQAWKIFSKLLLDDETGGQVDDEKTLNLYRFRHHICRPSENLSHYTQPLESSSFDFLSYLNISGFCEFDTSELLGLADMKNLAVLEIIQPSDEMRAVFPRVSDRLVRGWSEKDDPFPQMRILRLWGDESTTEQSLQYLCRFPKLLLFDVNGSRSDWKHAANEASKHHWGIAEPLYGLQDSLLWYFMLFTPFYEDQPKKLREVARNIDEGLKNFCLDGNRPVEFVPASSAPKFIDYVDESAKSNLPLYLDAPTADAQSCKGQPFETWAMFLYSFLGQVELDKEPDCSTSTPTKQAVSDKLVLPSKPMACIQLGHCGRSGISPSVAYVRRGLFATSRYTFYKTKSSGKGRQQTLQETAEFMRPRAQLSNVETGLTLNRQKRRRLDDLLQSFTDS